MNRDDDIFGDALEVPASERAAFLGRACTGDEALRARVEAMLVLHSEAPEFLQVPLTARSVATPEERPGDRIGRYKLLQKIGEGGMGVVYLAEQTEPVRRRVALKIIKLGMDTKAVVARFEAERQALAMMDHPNIARVLDGGATDTGRPYFVMDLVRGIRITEYCDEAGLTTRERLHLFIPVCQAIQHAHQKGIVHRDIKPSNILVTVNDGVAMPKVIDFGIAKATEGRLTDQTLVTQFEALIGTPAYMSPEQTLMTSVDVDTRSDIYSLGVLLYEMLAGRTPFDAKRLLASGLDEMRKTIREQEPIRPSTRLATLQGEELTTAAKRRSSDTSKLLHQLEGDLDWIVMKCLEKDRARRYETANGLANDIQRHLNNEAVLARPPSSAYRLQKLVRRNKLTFAALTSVAAVLVLGVIVSTWLALRAMRAEREQSRQRVAAVSASISEEVQRKLAETQRNIAVEQRKLADMQLALQAWDDGILHRAKDLIEASRPAPGQTPGFEWRYLRKLCEDQSIETFGSANQQYRSAQFFDHDLILLNDAKTLSLYDLSHRQRRVLLEDPDGIWTPALSSGNPSLLATVTDDGRIRVWDLAARRVRMELGGNLPAQFKTHRIDDSITFSREGRWLASAIIAEKSVKLWDVGAANLRPARIVHRYADWMSSEVFSPSGNHLFFGGSDSLVRTWDMATGEEEGAPLQGHTGWIYALALSPDGLYLASGGPDSTVIVWDVVSRTLVTRLVGHSGAVRALAFSPDGQILASAGRDHTIRLWDMRARQQISLLRGHGARVRHLSFSPDGQWLVSHSQEGLVKLWRATPDLEGNVLSRGQRSIRSVALSPDGRRLASSGMSSLEVDLWDLATRRRIVLSAHTEGVICTAFSPDNRILATGSHDQTVRLWDVSTDKAVATLRHGFPVGSVAFSPDGRTLIVGGSPLNFLVGNRGGLQFWDIPSKQATGTISGDTSDIAEIALSVSGALLATIHGDRLDTTISPDGVVTTTPTAGAVSLWDAKTRQFLHRFESPFGKKMNTVAFSPTEPLLAAGDWSGNIVLYNTETMTVGPQPLRAYTERVQSLAFSPDGRTLASSGEGGGLKLWNVAMGQVALTLKGHVGGSRGITFSNDGNLMVSGGADGTVRLWPAATLVEASAAARRE